MTKTMNEVLINFDSQDWNSIQDTYEKLENVDHFCFGKTAEGETIIISAGESEDGPIVTTEVFQNNGWTRKNIYHLSDYTIEELFSR